jgi:hypothetical protein
MPSHPLPEESFQYYRSIHIWVKEYKLIILNLLDANGEFVSEKKR